MVDKSILNAQEQEELFRLGEDIQMCLSCDVNGTRLPCRTDRLEAVSNMKRYLEIHNYTVIDKNKKPYRIMKSKSEREEIRNKKSNISEMEGA